MQSQHVVFCREQNSFFNRRKTDRLAVESNESVKKSSNDLKLMRELPCFFPRFRSSLPAISKNQVTMTEPATKKPREEAASEGEKDVIMVTGGSGLVGQAIRMYVESNKKDNEEWIYLSSKDGDLRVRADTDAIFAKYKPTHVIHLAAKVGGLFANMAQKVRVSCLAAVGMYVLGLHAESPVKATELQSGAQRRRKRPVSCRCDFQRIATG